MIKILRLQENNKQFKLEHRSNVIKVKENGIFSQNVKTANYSMLTVFPSMENEFHSIKE